VSITPPELISDVMAGCVVRNLGAGYVLVEIHTNSEQLRNLIGRLI